MERVGQESAAKVQIVQVRVQNQWFEEGRDWQLRTLYIL